MCCASVNAEYHHQHDENVCHAASKKATHRAPPSAQGALQNGASIVDVFIACHIWHVNGELLHNKGTCGSSMSLPSKPIGCNRLIGF